MGEPARDLGFEKALVKASRGEPHESEDIFLEDKAPLDTNGLPPRSEDKSPRFNSTDGAGDLLAQFGQRRQQSFASGKRNTRRLHHGLIERLKLC